MEDDVAPVFQVPPEFPKRTTELPLQKVVFPFAEIEEAVGNELTVTGKMDVVPLTQEL